MAEPRCRLFHEISVLPDALHPTSRNLVDFLSQFVQPRGQQPCSPDLDDLFDDDITSNLQSINHLEHTNTRFFSWDAFTEAMEKRHKRGETELIVDRVNHITIACPCSAFSTILDKLLTALLDATRIASHPDVDADTVEESVKSSFVGLGGSRRNERWTTFFPSSQKNIHAPFTDVIREDAAMKPRGNLFTDLDVLAEEQEAETSWEYRMLVTLIPEGSSGGSLFRAVLGTVELTADIPDEAGWGELEDGSKRNFSATVDLSYLVVENGFTFT